MKLFLVFLLACWFLGAANWTMAYRQRLGLAMAMAVATTMLYFVFRSLI